MSEQETVIETQAEVEVNTSSIEARELQLIGKLRSTPILLPLYEQLQNKALFDYYKAIKEEDVEDERAARRVIANFMHVKAVLQQVGLDANSPLVDAEPEHFMTLETFDAWVKEKNIPFLTVREYNPITGALEYRTDVAHPELRITMYDENKGNLFLKQLYFSTTMRFLPNSQKDVVFDDVLLASSLFETHEDCVARYNELLKEIEAEKDETEKPDETTDA